MQKTAFAAIASAISLSLTLPALTQEGAMPAPPVPLEGGYATVSDGLEMYYEIHGSGGTPLVLLHGAYATIELWGPILTGLAAGRQVIAVETQGHGHTADVDRPLSYEQMADDTAALIAQLGLQQVDLMGYSMGGTTALQVAIRHPELVRKLVVASTGVNRAGSYDEVWAGIEFMTLDIFEGTPPLEAYRRVAPNPDAFPLLFEKLKALDVEWQGWPTETIEAVTAPTLLVFGDSDIVRLAHATEMFELLGGGVPGDFVGMPDVQLAVLPGTGHLGVVLERAEWLTEMAVSFLDAPPPAAMPVP